MKKIFYIFIFLSFAIHCKADQLELLTREQASRAVQLLEKHAELILWCTCCNLNKGDQSDLIIISRVYFKKVDLTSNQAENYYVIIEGNNAIDNKKINKNIDLAYVYINKNGISACVGKILNLECEPCTPDFEWPDFSKTKDFFTGEDVVDNYDSPENHFNIFFNTIGDELEEIFINHQPTLNDCKILFKQNFHKTAYNYFNTKYQNIGYHLEEIENDFKKYKYFRVEEFNTNDVIKNNCSICPGKLKTLALKLNPNIKCYIVKFLKAENSEHGLSYTFFTQIDDRWVFLSM